MTVRFGLLGAGRIGKVHARAIGSNPAAKLVAVADAFEKAATDLASPTAPRCAPSTQIEKADGHRRGHHLHADRHACRSDRALRQGRQGDLLRKADRPRREARREVPGGRRQGRRDADGRLQPPLRSAFRRRAQGDRRRRDRHGRDGARSPRAIPGPPPLDYIGRSGGIFRDMTIHDFDMARFLLGEEPVAVSAHASVLVDKKIGEAGDFDSVSVILDNRVRQAVRHLQFAPRHLWLRPAHRGAWLERHDRGREPAAGVDRGRQCEGLYAPAAA